MDHKKDAKTAEQDKSAAAAAAAVAAQNPVAPSPSSPAGRKAKRGKVPTAAENEAIRAELKATTTKRDGQALYFIPEGGERFYRKGVLYPTGSVVALPLDEDPSISWLPVDKTTPTPAPAPVLVPVPGRPSDQGI